MLIWTNFNSFAITYISRLLEKFHFPIETVLNSLQTQKEGPGTSFPATVFVKIFGEIISFGIWHKLPKFH